MANRGEKTVLFLGPDAAPAAERFNAVAGQIGLPWRATAEATTADRVVALTEAGCPSAEAIDREIMGLVARLLGGGEFTPADPPPVTPQRPAKPLTARVGRETAGRRGKGVTTVSDLPPDTLADLATLLKQRCGTGGTVKDGRIEIQGDARDRVAAELEKLGYRVKRVGG